VSDGGHPQRRGYANDFFKDYQEIVVKTKFVGYALALVFALFLAGCVNTWPGGEPVARQAVAPPLSTFTMDGMHQAVTNAQLCFGCTSAQKEARWNQVRSDYGGKRVRWESWVLDVETDGTVVVSGVGRGLSLKGAPRNQATSLRVYQRVVFEGTLVAPASVHGAWTMVDVVLEPIIPTPEPTFTSMPIDDYNISLELVKITNRTNGKPSATFEIQNNGRKKIKVYTESTAVVGKYPPKIMQGLIPSSVMHLPPGIKRGENPQTFFSTYLGEPYDGDILQLCLYVYNTEANRKGNVVVAEFKLDNTLDCEGKPE
jgi:hypothetical protein